MEKSNIKTHKGFKIFLIIFIIGILFFTKKDNQEKFIEGFHSLNAREKTLESVEIIDLEQDLEEVYLYDKEIIKWHNNKITFLELDGSIKLEKEFLFQEPDILFTNKYIYIMDKSTGDVYTLNKEGETLKRFNLGNKIFNIKEIDGLMVHMKSDEIESINILDKEGKSIKNHNINNKNILTYSINENKDKYLISNLNLKEDKLKSEISIYSIEGEKIHNLDIKGEIVFFSEFIKDEIIALTDANLYLIKDGDIQWKKPFYSIKDVEHKDNRIYILYDNILEVVDLKGRTEEKFIIGSKYNKILPFGKYILLYGNNDLLGIQGSRQVINYKHPEEIIKIDTNKSIIGIYGDKKLELFKLINKT